MNQEKVSKQVWESTGGFGGDVTPELIRDWFKACFLFPIFRNHSLRHTRQQEPWAFDRKTQEVLSRFIRLRYRLRPYLYQLFIEQERSGEAILRPLFYDFQDTQELPIGLIDDQFMVGPAMMQAPFLEAAQTRRKVTLPGDTLWYDVAKDRWIKGGRKITVTANLIDTPLFIRDQSILPLAPLDAGEHEFRANQIDFHIYSSRNGNAAVHYISDDGLTRKYLSGSFSEWRVESERRGQTLYITTEQIRHGFGSADFCFTTLPDITQVIINGEAASKCARRGVPFGIAQTHTWKPS